MTLAKLQTFAVLSRLSLAGVFLVAGTALAAPFAVVGLDDPLCDVLDVPAAVEEIGVGEAAGGPFPLSESLESLYLGAGLPVCAASNDPFLPDPVVAILNTTGRPFPEVWYVADSTTSLSNGDGLAGEGLGPATLPAFKIDTVGDNQPLIFESLTEDGVWEPGEVWYFVIQDFVNSAGAGPADFGSLGMSSTGSSSSASILVEGVLFTGVTTLADNGPGSLRDVIAAATPGDVITFAPDLSGGTITLGGSQLFIDKDLTIDASSLGNGITVSGDVTGDGPTPDDSRVLEVNGGITVELKGLTISSGHTTANGGGILNSTSTLTLTGTMLSGNSANEGAGVYNSFGTLNVNDSIVMNNTAASNGGGVRSRGGGGVHIDHSSISGNTATSGGGGGIFEDFSTEGVTMANSTLSGNTAVFGAGLYSQNSVLALTNTTVSGNATTSSAGGGLYLQQSTTTLTHTTIANNAANGSGGGGLVVGNSAGVVLTTSNTIIAGNSGSPGADIWYFGGDIVSTGVNLIGDNATVATGFPSGFPNVNGDLVGAPALLAPLEDYGGPTKTMPPLPGSPVIEGAVLLAGTPDTDQRGSARPSGPLPDIGAVEAFPFSTLTLVDADSDGIDDRIESAYPQFTVGVDDSGLDSDGDGLSDAEELDGMTNPNDANDGFRLLSFAPAPGFDAVTNPVFDVTIATFPGLSYELEISGNLEDYQLVPGAQFTADDYTRTFEVLFSGESGFVRAKRN